jgi:HSP20 family protein
MPNKELAIRKSDRYVPARREYENPFYSLQGRMNRLMDDFFEGSLFPRLSEAFAGTFEPKIDIKESGKELVVSAELPGIDEKDVEVFLSDDCLTIKGEKNLEKEEENEGYYRVERSYGAFRRAIPLYDEIDTDKSEAKFEKGILKVKLRKTEAKSRTKKIPIKM